jgi:hypothetical protein
VTEEEEEQMLDAINAAAERLSDRDREAAGKLINERVLDPIFNGGPAVFRDVGDGYFLDLPTRKREEMLRGAAAILGLKFEPEQ